MSVRLQRSDKITEPRPASIVRRDYLFGGTAFVAGVALTQWVNVGVLCRGNPRFDSGCAGIPGYIGDELVALGPGLLLAFLAILVSNSTSRRRFIWFAVMTTLLGGVLLEFRGFHRWPGTGAAWLVTAFVFCVIRGAAGSPSFRRARRNALSRGAGNDRVTIRCPADAGS